MEQMDIQQISQQLNQILNLIQETRNDMKLLAQCIENDADDPLIPNRQVAKILDIRPKQYMLTLLGAICFRKNLDYLLTPQDVCDFLEIDFETFEQALMKADPKHTLWQGGKIFTLETMVRVAEIATRPQRFKNLLKQVPK